MNAIKQCLSGSEISYLKLKDSEDWFKHMIKLITRKPADSEDLLSFINKFFKPLIHRKDFERHIFVPKMQADAQEFLIYVLANIND